ncbi:Sepiapterin reductase [Orchesella cincta]|uniref:Sepiapterin reductase n=1 Tax=Orchesella cincta TaxID=48709 RepID=A0A1D2ME33_ORCCI|nr:Sepiapterin reductase [Orchesella cincta]
MSLKMEYWNQKTFCLVTGASRGIGRTIAIEFSKKVANQSVFLLMARSTSALEETKSAISAATEGRVSVITSTIDLEKPDKDAYLSAIVSALTQTNTTASDFDHSILVHNAGSLGVEKKLKVVEMEDLADLSGYFSLNVISMVILSTQFFKTFNDTAKQRSIVQITSLSGLQPFKTWGLYCTSKAARDMLMKVVALESGIQVLNWAPGPVETEMFDNVCKHTGDPDLLKAFTECREEGKVLTCEQTVTKLVKVLAEKKYVNGEHVDYFDVE